MKKENTSSNLGAQENLYCVSMNEINNLHDGSIFQIESERSSSTAQKKVKKCIGAMEI